MKLKKCFGALIALCLMLFIIGGVFANGAFDTKLIAGIGGGGHEFEFYTMLFHF